MQTNYIHINEYIPPKIERISVRVEGVFATSVNQEDDVIDWIDDSNPDSAENNADIVLNL
ncbi:MAG: hypothetical protein LBE56_15140 [Tannerella sp.]|jgi:hypothetical protein|nr:hypothetical protein [Tannerella sp.]